MGVIREGVITPATARTNLVEPQSLRCQKRTCRSGLPLVEFSDLATSCNSTPRVPDLMHATKNVRAIMPERRIGATTWEVWPSFLKAKQQTSEERLTQLARELSAIWIGVCAVAITNEQREKEKEMLKTPPKSTPNRGKGKHNGERVEGGRQVGRALHPCMPSLRNGDACGECHLLPSSQNPPE